MRTPNLAAPKSALGLASPDALVTVETLCHLYWTQISNKVLYYMPAQSLHLFVSRCIVDVVTLIAVVVLVAFVVSIDVVIVQIVFIVVDLVLVDPLLYVHIYMYIYTYIS